MLISRKTTFLALAFVFFFSNWGVSQCNLSAIRTAYTGAGCVELANCQDACSLYFIYPVTMSANSAQAFAQTLGGNLISVESPTENTCIINNLNALGFGGVIWIGYNDIASENNFVWFDQAPVVYTNWAPGEPNNSGNEDCTQIYPNGGWNDLSCSSANSRSVLEVNLCPQVTITSNPANATVCAGQGVTLTASTILGSPPYNYSWSPATGLNTTTGNVVTAMPASTTTYTCSITDRWGCPSSQTKTVVINSPGANAGADQTTCAGTPVQLAAGPGGTSYSWSQGVSLSNPNISNPVATPMTTTTYTLTVIGATGCSATDQVTVNVNPLPPANAGPDAFMCIGTPINLSASGGNSYSWSPATGLSNPAISNPVANPAATTVYTVTVTDGNNCVATDAINVGVNPLPTPSAGADQAICIGSSANLSANGAASYVWTPAGTLSNPNVFNPVATPIATTLYTVTATDANGCVATDDVNVTVNPLPIANAGPDVSICIGGATNLQASGGNAYSWTPATGLSNVGIANPVANPLASIIYTATVRDANNCIQTDNVAVTVNPLPPANAGPDVAICINDNIALNASGGITYSWSPAAGLSDPAVNNPTANPVVTTIYTVTVTDANTCVNTDDITVTVNPLPTPNAGLDQAICIGSTANLSANGAATYVWTPAGTLNFPNSAAPVATPVATTTYIVTATDANGCVATDDVIVTVNPLPPANAGHDASICDGLPTNLLATGGTIYSWLPVTGLSDSNIADPVASPPATTLYTVTVTDGNGCVNTDDVNITFNPLPVIDAGLDVPICINDNAVLNAQGGVSYTWLPITGLSNPAVSNPVASPLVTTLYTVTGTDINGCINTDDITITVNPLPTPSAGADQPICIGLSANLLATGAVSYVWIPAATLDNPNIAGPVATPAGTTIYTVTGTDANGCSASDDVEITVNPLPPADAGNDVEICDGLSTPLLATGGIIYSWSPAAGLSVTNVDNPMASPAVTTIYTVTVTDANGCINTDDVEVLVNPLPIANAGVDVLICFGDNTQLGASGGISYTWLPTTALSSATVANPIASPAATITYTVTATDINGCIDDDDMEVAIAPLPVPNAGPNEIICDGATITLQGTGNGTIFSWSPTTALSDPNIATPDANPTSTITYTLTVSDVNNCSATDDILVEVNPTPVASFTANEVCLTFPTQFTDQSTISLGTIDTYSWDFGNAIGTDATANPSYTYITDGTFNPTLTVTSDNNCSDTYTLPVIVNPLPIVDFSASRTTGCMPLYVDFTNNSSISSLTPMTFHWNLGNGSMPVTTQATENVNTTYQTASSFTVSLTAISDKNCITTLTLPDYVLTDPKPQADFTFNPETADILLDPVVLFTDQSIGNPTLWSWEFGGIGVSDIQNPQFEFTDTGTFRIELAVENEFGCQDTITKTLVVTPAFTLYVPNAFTPGGDKVNETFLAKGLGVAKFEMVVLDRWGSVVFRTQNLYEGWNGTLRNSGPETMKQDLYTYQINIRDFQDYPHYYRGTVMLIR